MALLSSLPAALLRLGGGALVEEEEEGEGGDWFVRRPWGILDPAAELIPPESPPQSASMIAKKQYLPES